MSKFAVLACVIGIVALAPQSRADDPVTLDSKTKQYQLTLQIGPTETMYSETEAKAKRPTSGEIMLSGKMVGGMTGMMPMSGMRHLELHVHSIDTGKVVTNARVTIVLKGSDKKRQMLPIVRMYGVTEGLDDLHYGNNVMLSPGAYTVDATVNGEAAHFSVTVPAGS